jgi:hypothetical protein
MEENRLRPMTPGYDVNLFNTLFKKTEPLRKKLASEISCDRFGVDYNEVLSWFSVKFIYVFNKYQGKKAPDLLLGDIINSMKNFKCRVLRQAYTVKYSQNIVRVGYTTVLENAQTYRMPEEDESPDRMKAVKEFLRSNLSENAYTLFEMQLNPPYYFIDKLRKQEIPSLHKIPDRMLCEYLGFEVNDRTSKYIASLRKEIRSTIAYAKYHFQNSPTVLA